MYHLIPLLQFSDQTLKTNLEIKNLSKHFFLLRLLLPGTEGAIILAFEQEEKLLKRFTPSFVDQIQNLLEEISAIRESKIAGLFC